MAHESIVSSWKECVEQLLAKDGYMITVSPVPEKIGSVLPDIYKLGIPFRVVGVGTREDAIRQFEECRRMSGADIVEPPAWPYIYKLVVAD